MGPLTVPVWLLAIAGCLAGGLLAARVPLRAHRRVRARVTELVGNAAFAFAVVWKLSPVARNPRGIFTDPLPLLMAAPGLLGLVAGSVAAIAAVAISLLRHRRLRRVSLLPLVLFVAVAGAGIGAAELASGLVRSSRAAPELVLPLLGGGEMGFQQTCVGIENMDLIGNTNPTLSTDFDPPSDIVLVHFDFSAKNPLNATAP